MASIRFVFCQTISLFAGEETSTSPTHRFRFNYGGKKHLPPHNGPQARRSTLGVQFTVNFTNAAVA